MLRCELLPLVVKKAHTASRLLWVGCHNCHKEPPRPVPFIFTIFQGQKHSQMTHLYIESTTTLSDICGPVCVRNRSHCMHCMGIPWRIWTALVYKTGKEGDPKDCKGAVPERLDQRIQPLERHVRIKRMMLCLPVTNELEHITDTVDGGSHDIGLPTAGLVDNVNISTQLAMQELSNQCWIEIILACLQFLTRPLWNIIYENLNSTIPLGLERYSQNHIDPFR